MRFLNKKKHGPLEPEADVSGDAPRREEPGEEEAPKKQEPPKKKEPLKKQEKQAKQKKPAGQKKKWKKTFGTGMAIGLLAMLIVGGIFGTLLYFNEIRPVPHGFKTPEEAVKACFRAVQKGDPEAAANTFAMEEYRKHFDFTAYLSGLRAYSSDPGAHCQAFPGANALTRGFNLEQRRCQVDESFRALCRKLLLLREETGSTGKLLPRPPGKQPPEPPEQLLSRLKLRKILTPEDLCREFPGLKKGWKPADKKAMEALFPRCEDGTERILKFESGGRTCYLDLTLIRLDGKWFVLSLTGTLPGGDGTCALFTEEALKKAAK